MSSRTPDLLKDGKNAENAPADDNVIQTFQLEESRLRGRAVRLGGTLDDILNPHNYPEPVAKLTAETVTLAALLSSMLKYDGIFTLQTKGEGAVSMTVADITSTGVLRGCASFDPKKVEYEEKELIGPAERDSGHNCGAHYLGKGYIAFTVDPGGTTAQRYQGIVELKGSSLMECAQHYFTQSEQIGTSMRLAVSHNGERWRAGAIMLQRMPEELAKDPVERSKNDEDWRRALALLDTCTDVELLSPTLHSNALLFRLFHEEGVRVYPPLPVTHGCRCDAKKVENMLVTMGDEDLKFMAKSGDIEAKCEFCSRVFKFTLEDIRKLKSKS